MNYSLFDEIERTDIGPMQHNETHYEYLNRSARPEAERIRSLLEDWFSRYPKKEQANFLIRFRDKEEHDSAFFELYLHEILLQQGFKCEAHPNLPVVEKHPEFLVCHKGRQCFYLEAKIVYPNNKVSVDFLSGLDAIKSDFDFAVSLEGQLKTKPPVKDFKIWLKQRREPEEVYRIKDAGAEITITLLAKCQSTGNVLVVGETDKTTDAIRKAIHKKATAYKKLNLPFLLAINVVNIRLQKPVEPEQVVDAMFGQRVVFFHKGTKETSHARDYKSAKLLSPRGATQNTRVSGIIVMGSLNPWTITNQNIAPELWHNPWAEYPFPPELWQLPQQIPKEVYEKKEGKAVLELLGLPPNWPRAEITTPPFTSNSTTSSVLPQVLF